MYLTPSIFLALEHNGGWAISLVCILFVILFFILLFFKYSILRSFKAGPKCIKCDTEVCESIAIIRKRIAIVHGDGMAAAYKLLSFASVILSVSPCCLALCYPRLWSRWVWLTEGMPMRPSTACFWEQEGEYAFELLERWWLIVFGGWCGRSDG